MCLNALYMLLLKLGLVYVWMRFIWYYWNESLYVSFCPLYDIIKMMASMCLNALIFISHTKVH